jgi:four helix bundle protein
VTSPRKKSRGSSAARILPRRGRVPIRNYVDLVAWQRAMSLATSVYRRSDTMPPAERFGLTTQMRRAAVSIPSNIAEGQGRHTDGEFLNHLSVAHGSLRELETQIMLSERLELLSTDAAQGLLADAAEVGRLLNGLANSIRRGHR